MMKHFMLLMFTVMMFTAQAQGWNQASTITRTLRFSYGGHTFEDQLVFKASDYNYYRSLSKTQAYTAYATEHSTHPYLLQLAKVLDEDANDHGYTGYHLAEYLTAFVQQLPYKVDPYNNGYDYPKYPIETLVEIGGDCEDHAALEVALLNVFGFDAIMVALPGHMAAGLSCANCGTYYNYNGKNYAFIETTNPRNIGEIPYEFQRANATLLPVATTTRFNREEGNRNPTPDNGGNWGEQASNRGSDWINVINNGTNNTNSMSTVTINGITYQVKGTGSTSIVVSGANVTITYH